jgi:hypothetical protein
MKKRRKYIAGRKCIHNIEGDPWKLHNEVKDKAKGKYWEASIYILNH